MTLSNNTIQTARSPWLWMASLQVALIVLGFPVLAYAQPSVVTITRDDPNPTDQASVDFTVVFSQNVTGVDTSDFAIDAFNVSGASVTGVSEAGARTPSPWAPVPATAR